MTLDQAKNGSEVQILSVQDPEIRSKLVRIGISEGSVVVCMDKLPFGPVILRSKSVYRNHVMCLLQVFWT
ncbi:MAG: ferrous iron transport protein A [Armatimonadetes bacterium]|nr:ferrous iron transport protein A [Armatimonadota bacterium]